MSSKTGLEVAIVGMAGKFPGAKNIEEFWENLKNGVESIKTFTDEELINAGVERETLNNSNYVKSASVLEDIDLFDANYFDYSPREAEVIDPQQRIFLECAVEALENAGYDSKRYTKSVGVFAGSSINTYMLNNLYTNQKKIKDIGAFQAMISNDKDYLATRVSYKLNLTGPSVTVQTACSTGLVAVHLGVQSLLNGDCDMALAGGASIRVPNNTGYTFEEGGIASPDGHCRAFDSEAKGTVTGNGVGIVVLKRLEDALDDGDNVLAVIKGSAINNDGAQKVGFTAPSVQGQTKVIKAAQYIAEVEPETISYIECHGTATILGDPIEISALKQAFGTQEKKGYCAIGSVKTNIGHLDTAAGVAGLIKTVLSLKHKELVPSLHYKSPNPNIDFENSPFYVNTKLHEWKTEEDVPRRAAVSSFGIGGTNAHLILEEAPHVTKYEDLEKEKIYLLSAKSEEELEEVTEQLCKHLNNNPEISTGDLAYTLQTGRSILPYRRFAIARNAADLISTLSNRNPERVFTLYNNVSNRPIAFMFPGQGSQHINMARDLYEQELVFQKEVDLCCELLLPQLGIDLRDLLFPKKEKAEEVFQRINETRYAQPALFVIEYSLAKLWISWGVVPNSMIGHSIGEYTAACLAGVFSLDKALNLVVIRGSLMQAMDSGSMLIIPMSEEKISVYLDKRHSIAAVNAQELCVVSSTHTAIDELIKILESDGIQTRKLHTSHAFHSSMMDPVLEPFRLALEEVRLSPPKTKFISSLTGDWITAEEATDPQYWVNQLRYTVRFSDGISTLLKQKNLILLEVGPLQTLGALVKQNRAKTDEHIILNTLTNLKENHFDYKNLLTTYGKLWLSGYDADLSLFYKDKKRYRIPLPTYPFARKRYWIEPGILHEKIIEKKLEQDSGLTFFTQSWNRMHQSVKQEEIDINQTNGLWILFADRIGIAKEIASYLGEKGEKVFLIDIGNNYSFSKFKGCTINPLNEDNYLKLFNDLKSNNLIPKHIIHFWDIDSESISQNMINSKKLTFNSLFSIAEALQKVDNSLNVKFTVLTNKLCSVESKDQIDPDKGAILGLIPTFDSKYIPLSVRLIDVGEVEIKNQQKNKWYRQVINELINDSSDKLIALRGHYRWVPNLINTNIKANKTKILQDNGTYLIVNALNDEGISIAEEISNLVQSPRIILIGEKSTIINVEYKDRVKRLEEKGTIIEVNKSLDVLRTINFENLEWESEYGQVNGVIFISDKDMFSPILNNSSLNKVEKLEGIIKYFGNISKEIGSCVKDFVIFSCLNLDFKEVMNNAIVSFLSSFSMSKSFEESIMWSTLYLEPSIVNVLENKKVFTNGEVERIFNSLLTMKLQPQTSFSIEGNNIPTNLALQKDDDEKLLSKENTGSHSRPNILTTYIAPRDENEKKIANIFSRVLGIDSIGAYDDFFELGGHSLMGTQVVVRMREELDIDIPISLIFENPTVAGIALLLSSKSEKNKGMLLEKASRLEEFPLSFSQKRLWFLHQMEPESTQYHINAALRLKGDLSSEILEKSLNDIIARHESLRTVFPVINDSPKQKVLEHLYLQIPYMDLSHVSEWKKEEEVRKIFIGEVNRPFNLVEGPLMRIKLLKLDSEEHVLLMVIHHIVYDGWSTSIFLRELTELYKAYLEKKTVNLINLPFQYVDYAASQKKWLQGEVLSNQLTYWKEQLKGLDGFLQLPNKGPRPVIQTFKGKRKELKISSNLTLKLKELSKKEDVTLFMTLLSAFKTLLYRYSNQEDICVGIPVTNRALQDLENMIGYFVNTLPLRSDLSGNPKFLDLLQRIRSVTLSAYDHKDVPLERLIEELNLKRDLSYQPLFQVAFVLQNTPIYELKLGDVDIETFEIDEESSKFDLTMKLVEKGETLEGVLEYNVDLYDEYMINNMIQQYINLLESIVKEPEQRLLELPLLKNKERNQLIKEWAESKEKHEQNFLLHELFELQAQENPNAVAIEFNDDYLTYKTLNQKANQLAKYLLTLGIGPEKLVGLSIERSLDLAICILAIHKTGGAYVPIDSAHPKERCEYMLKDAEINVLLTQKSLIDHFSSYEGPIVLVDTDAEAINKFDSNDLKVQLPLDLTAYIIYTSGSTGRPKGVIITHRNVIRLFKTTEKLFDFNKNDVWTMFHSYAFDFSVWEFWGPLLSGGKLVIVPYLTTRTPKEFYDLLINKKVTVLNQTPSAFQQLIQIDNQISYKPTLSLRYIIFGGERLEPKSIKPWFDRHGNQQPQLINMYGITETTVHATYCRLTESHFTEGKQSVIGKPLPDLELYVLNQALQPTPIGVPGEIYIGGEGLSRGYLNRPELTKERFILHPFSSNKEERLYKTGDMGSWMVDGSLEYIGRLDNQVKIRGFRIEIGEIETVLNELPQVTHSIVVIDKSPSSEIQLIAYLTIHEEARIDVIKIREFLVKKLPDYMVPTSFVMLSEIPLTINGKIDYNSLPKNEDIKNLTMRTHYVPPQNPNESLLISIWEEVLGISNVGIDDNFFTLGGDSINSIKVLSKMKENNLNLSLQNIFKYQTVRELIQLISMDESEFLDENLSIKAFELISNADQKKLPYAVEDAYPLASLQAGMLFHSEYSPDSSVYHDVFSFNIQTALDIEKLENALKKMSESHPILRTFFDLSNYSEPIQLVRKTIELTFHLEDIKSLSKDKQELVISNWIKKEKHNRFNYQEEQLIRFFIHLRDLDNFQFSLSFHHALLDGWSVASMLTELFQIYFSNMGLTSQALNSAPGLSYRNFIHLEHKALADSKSKEYWINHLINNNVSVLPKIKDKENLRGEQSMRYFDVEIPIETSSLLQSLAQTCGVTLKSVLLAAHMKVLSFLTGQTDVTTGLIMNGRPEHKDGERILGLFLNTIPFRTRAVEGTWSELIKSVFKSEQELLPYRRYPLATLQRQFGGQLFETAFNYVHFHVYEELTNIDGVKLIGEEIFEETNFSFSVNFGKKISDGSVQLRLNYDASLFEEEQIDEISAYYIRILNDMARNSFNNCENFSPLSESERKQLLLDWNQASSNEVKPLCAHELFEEQVEKNPNAIAIHYKDSEMTYQELDNKANRLANYLIKMNVGPEVLVGIFLDKSPNVIVSILAIMKAGGAYLPLDPSLPKKRQSYIMEDSKVQVVITESSLLNSLPEVNAKIISIDLIKSELALQSDEKHKYASSLNQLAYVIYTSGSTGRPKGVQVEHKGIANLIEEKRRVLKINSNSRILQFANLAFDASFIEIFSALGVGATLCIAKKEELLPGTILTKTLNDMKITVITLPPSILAVLPEEDIKFVRTIVTAGEATSAELINRFAGQVRYINAYGPTEGTVCATMQVYDESSSSTIPTIGRPISNMEIYLLDSHGLPVPVGVPGEIYIGGIGVARGYLNNQALTEEKFIKNLFSKNSKERLYRTGDLGRYLVDGQIEFLGRIDHQIKLRGLRIELQEIEAVLYEQFDIKQAYVMLREDAPGDKRIVAYIIPSDKSKIGNQTEMRNILREILPDYMVPSFIVFLDTLPLTANGSKVDRNLLQAPFEIEKRSPKKIQVSKTDLEKKIINIWKDVLGIEEIGVLDNFFDLGGHSLLALQVHTKLKTAFSQPISITDLFKYPTVRELSKFIEQQDEKKQIMKSPQERASTRSQFIRNQKELRQDRLKFNKKKS